MKKLIVIGNGTYAQMMCEYIKLTNFGEVCAFAVEKEFITVAAINEIPVLSLEKMIEDYPCQSIELIMGIGYTQMGKVREKIFHICKEAGYRFSNFIHPSAIISPDVVMGEGNNIFEGVIIEVGVSIGDANLLYCGSIIAHETRIGSFNTLSCKATLLGCVNVGNNCFLGGASTVKDHVAVDDFVLLGAMAYGYKNLDKYSVVVPSRSKILQNKKSIDYL